MGQGAGAAKRIGGSVSIAIEGCRDDGRMMALRGTHEKGNVVRNRPGSGLSLCNDGIHGDAFPALADRGDVGGIPLALDHGVIAGVQGPGSRQDGYPQEGRRLCGLRRAPGGAGNPSACSSISSFPADRANRGLFSSTLSEHLSLFVKLLFAIGRIDGGLSFSVADFHLAEDLLQGGIPSGKELVQQRADIRATQQRSGLLMQLTLFQ